MAENPWDYTTQAPESDWFDQQAPSTPIQSNPSAGRVAELYRRVLGREPRPEELAQWGSDIDDRFATAIERALRESAEGQAYAQRQRDETLNPPSNAPGPAPTSPGPGGLPSEWTRDSLKAYARSRGVEWTDQQADYWLTKKGELDARGREIGDPNYANMRLSLADEWTPSDQRYAAWSGGGSGLQFGDLIKPFTEQFTYEDFKAPTQEDLKGDPGFQASLDRANDSLQRSAAAKGSLLSGSTLRDLSENTAAMSQAGYRDLFGRQLQTYSTNRQNAADQYQQRRANFYQNQDSPYAKLFGMAQLDSQNQNYLNNLNLQYAQLGAGTIMGGAGAATGYGLEGANANAAGTVGSSNAYSSMFRNLSQIPWYIAAQRGTGGGRLPYDYGDQRYGY